MSLRVNEQLPRLHKSSQRKNRKQRSRSLMQRPPVLDAPLTQLSDQQVLLFIEWCRLNRISERTGRRILKSGMGPAVVELSAKRIGITVGANRDWQQSRARSA